MQKSIAMEDTFKKLLHTGIGAVSLAKAKIDEVVDDLMDKGRLSREEGEKILNDFKKDSATSKAAMQKEMSQWMEKALNRMEIARKKEVEDLRQQIEELQKRVTALEAADFGGSRQ